MLFELAVDLFIVDRANEPAVREAPSQLPAGEKDDRITDEDGCNADHRGDPEIGIRVEIDDHPAADQGDLFGNGEADPAEKQYAEHGEVLKVIKPLENFCRFQ